MSTRRLKALSSDALRRSQTYGFQKLATEYFAKGAGSSINCRILLRGPSTA